MSVDEQIIHILAEVLSLDETEAEKLDRSSPLLGHLPEFDSMAVVSIITILEERLGLLINDEELNADIFADVGSLVDFVKAHQESN